MSIVPHLELQISGIDELKSLRAETDMLREQMKLMAHHVNYLRDCILRQTVINDKIVDILDRRTAS